MIQSGSVGGFFGNSTTTNRAICRSPVPTASACLANDFDIVELIGEVEFKVAGRPLMLFADLARNSQADYYFASINPALNSRSGLDNAVAAGFTYGNARAPGSWEVGYLYQRVEKDALMAQWFDSSFGAGATDSSGSVLRVANQIAGNLRFNLTYLLNQTNNAVPASVPIPVARSVFDRDYRRLLLDLNLSY